MAFQPERTARSDSAAICVSTYHKIWRPVRLVLTEGQLVCHQASKIILSVPLSAVLGVEVVETKVILGLKRKALLVDVGKAKRLICVKNPEEWRNQILLSRGENMVTSLNNILSADSGMKLQKKAEYPHTPT